MKKAVNKSSVTTLNPVVAGIIVVAMVKFATSVPGGFIDNLL